MSRMKFYFGVIGVSLLLGACSPYLTPITQDIIDNNQWSEHDFEHIQFYLSKDLVLTKTINRGNTKIKQGSVKIMDGKMVDQIIFKKGTPGVFVFSPKSERMAISFEQGGEKRFLIFGLNPKLGDKYVLLAKEWNNRIGKISYDGMVYTIPTYSAYTSLMVDLKRTRNIHKKTRKVKGRSLK